MDWFFGFCRFPEERRFIFYGVFTLQSLIRPEPEQSLRLQFGLLGRPQSADGFFPQGYAMAWP